MKLSKASISAAILAAFAACTPSQASIVIPSGYEALNFNVSLNDGVDGVSNIVFFDTQTSGVGYQFYDGPLPAGSGSVTELWPYAIPGFTQVGAAFGVGLVTGLPSDSDPSTQHLALFGNFTSGQIGDSFSTLFPDVASESTLINDIANQTNLNNGCTFNCDGFQSLYSDALNAGLFITPGSDFQVVAFTDGQQIGQGTLTAEGLPAPSDVPEAPSLPLFVSALLALAGTLGLRRRAR